MSPLPSPPRARPTAVLALLGALSGLLPAAASAKRPDELVGEARRQYAAQEYERVIRLVRPVADNASATDRQRVDAYEMLGLCQLILGQQAEARQAFEKLLRIDRQHVLRDPSESPKLRRFFESVRASLPPPPAPTRPELEETAAPQRPRAGRSATFSARVAAGAEQVHWVVLHHRRQDGERFSTVTMSRQSDGRYSARVRLPEAKDGYQLAYYFEARDRAGAAAATVGSADEPLTVLVRATRPGPRASSPFYKKWWFWTLAGAAVAGGATAVIILARQQAPEGNLGPKMIQLPLAARF